MVVRFGEALGTSVHTLRNSEQDFGQRIIGAEENPVLCDPCFRRSV